MKAYWLCALFAVSVVFQVAFLRFPAPTSSGNPNVVLCGPPPHTEATAVSQLKMSYRLVVPPSVNAPRAVLAIVPDTASITLEAAVSLSETARRHFRAVGNWNEIQIFVFRDLPSAQRFKDYQSPRLQRPLGASDYQKLRKLWPSVLAFRQYRNGSEIILYPSRNPSDWWKLVR